MGTESTGVYFNYYVPRKPLSSYVPLFWYWKGHDAVFSKERLLPCGTVELVIRLDKGQPLELAVAGPRTRYSLLERRMDDEFLGIHFRPGGAAFFFHCPLAELQDEVTGLSNVSIVPSKLIDQLFNAASVQARFSILERWLLERACRSLEGPGAIESALLQLQNNPCLSSKVLADRMGYSQRHFIELFRSEVGLTPKLLGRILRFQQLLRSIATKNPVDWAEAALAAGYYDQAHLIHEFQQFTGLNPTEYLSLRTENLNHVGHKE